MQKGKIQIIGKGFLKGFIKMAIVSMLFYRNIMLTVLTGVLAGMIGIRLERKQIRVKEQKEMVMQFRDGLQGIASALSAGYAMENAFMESRKDLVLLYGEDSLLANEFLWNDQQIEMNQPMEKVLCQFAKKWNIEDISSFAQIFQTAKRTGGDLIRITRSCAEKNSLKIEVSREIQTMIAGKKMESRIMNAIPLGIIIYFWLCSPGFLDCMYRASGRIIMTVLMSIYLFAYYWSDRICDIRV